MMLKKIYRYSIRELKFYMTRKPYFLNYPAATVCNHKCVMCNLHEIKKPKDITYEQLREMVVDPLFENIESIGLSGGEPYMKKDIVETCEVLLDSLPSLKHFSINTNGRLPKRFEKTLPEIKKMCAKKGVVFNVVLSMDGVGETHNKVRGVSDAWEKLLESFDILKNNGMVPSVLMTIHRFNWSEVFKVYKYCVDNDIVPYFGIATVIERLDNEGDYDGFSLFDWQKRYLWEFFRNLSKNKNLQLNKRIWYRLLGEQLIGHTERRASCVAYDRGVYLSDDGKLSYCGVYDKQINVNGYSSLFDAYSDKAVADKIRAEMKEKHCQTCMHDYQSKPRFADLIGFVKEEAKIKQMASLLKLPWLMNAPVIIKQEKKISGYKNVLLYGWFGTETTGDKAIYGECVSRINDLWRGAKVNVLSSETAYTSTTMAELDIVGVTIVSKSDLSKSLSEFDAIIFCGGPVMGYANLAEFLWLSRKAKKVGIANLIYGVGWGPFKNALYEKAAINFLKLADAVLVRDEKSFEILSEFLDSDKLYSACDPALEWASRQPKFIINKNKKTLGVSIRELSAASLGLNSETEYHRFRDEYLSGISEVIDNFVERHSGLVKLIPMNTYHMGGDDRAILSDLKLKCRNEDSIEVMDGFYSPSKIVGAFDSCDYFIGMRFHSTIFAFARNIPVIGLDYILPEGKISAFFEKTGSKDYLIKIKDFCKKDLGDKLDSLVNNERKIKDDQKRRADEIRSDYKTKSSLIFSADVG